MKKKQTKIVHSKQTEEPKEKDQETYTTRRHTDLHTQKSHKNTKLEIIICM